ncbi:hypothetical protein CF68_22510 [Cupriavidus sp. SK-4]|nr:hypothetical protein CF68_22510 [Cupriavidus sp. SK-4]
MFVPSFKIPLVDMRCCDEKRSLTAVKDKRCTICEYPPDAIFFDTPCQRSRIIQHAMEQRLSELASQQCGCFF